MKDRRKPQGPAIWLWLLPFVVMTLVSTTNAERFDWAAFEIYRLAKLLLAIILLRRLIRSCLSKLKVAHDFHSGDLRLPAVAVWSVPSWPPTRPSFWRRRILAASSLGSMGHPNAFSSYLEVIWPICGMLAVVPGKAIRRSLAAAAGCAHFMVGIAVAQSRAVWFIAIGQMLLLFAGVIGLRLVPVKRALGLAIVFCMAGALALAPFAPRIERRIVSNWKASTEFRSTFDALALRMYKDRPWIGGGPRQFPLRFAPHAWELYGRLENKIPPFPVHNFYLLELVEYGAFGLGAFVCFIVAVYVYAAGQLRSPPLIRAVTYGICIGILGILVHQLSELVLILDPNLYTFGTLIALLGLLPLLRQPEQVQAVVCWA